MVENITIRNEVPADYRAVEEITRRAFWNLYVPGCVEHYVAHVIRAHEDFIPELDFVIELNGKIIGNIMYTKARLIDELGNEKDILTFGPVCILPEHQRKGYGKRLMEYSFDKAVELGYDVIVIFGSPANYVSSGFKSCKKYNVCIENGKFPTAMLVKELIPKTLDGKKLVYCGSPAMEIEEVQAQAFDKDFEQIEKRYQPSQDEFYIYSHSFVE